MVQLNSKAIDKLRAKREKLRQRIEKIQIQDMKLEKMLIRYNTGFRGTLDAEELKTRRARYAQRKVAREAAKQEMKQYA